jgi:hypothetical protein
MPVKIADPYNFEALGLDLPNLFKDYPDPLQYNVPDGYLGAELQNSAQQYPDAYTNQFNKQTEAETKPIGLWTVPLAPGTVKPGTEAPSEESGGDGGGGGGGGNYSQGNAAKPINYTTPWDAKFNELYAKFGNVPLPYDANKLAVLEGKLKAATASTEAQKKLQFQAQRSSQGLGAVDNGRTAQGLRNITQEAGQQFNTGMIDVNDLATKANYTAEVQNLQNQLRTLDTQANLVIGLANSETQRQSVMNAYVLERMRIEAQLDSIKLQIGYGLTGL